MDREVWWAVVHGVTKESDTTERLNWTESPSWSHLEWPDMTHYDGNSYSKIWPSFPNQTKQPVGRWAITGLPLGTGHGPRYMWGYLKILFTNPYLSSKVNWVTRRFYWLPMCLDTKGTFNAKMGSIKDRNGLDLTEAEDIKKRWQENTKNYAKEIFMMQITTMVWSLTYSQTSWNVKSSGP